MRWTPPRARASPGGTTRWNYEAIDSLVGPGYAITLSDDDPDDVWYVEGRHRATAMLDAGVRETIVARLELLDPATGQPLRWDESGVR